MLWIIAIDIVLLLALLVKLFVFGHPMPEITASHYGGSAAKIVTVGPEIESLVNLIKGTSTSPVVVKDVTRRQFTAPGKLVVLDGDNFQVFEYVSRDTATHEASMLAQRYASSSRSKAWKKNAHIYVNDRFVVFYMGSNKAIVKSLEQNAGLSMTHPAKLKPLVTKAGN
jgi:hypothetical protein